MPPVFVRQARASAGARGAALEPAALTFRYGRQWRECRGVRKGLIRSEAVRPSAGRNPAAGPAPSERAAVR